MSTNARRLDASDDVHSLAKPRKIGKMKNWTTRNTLNASTHDIFASFGDSNQAVVAPELPTLPLLSKLPYIALKTSLLQFIMTLLR